MRKISVRITIKINLVSARRLPNIGLMLGQTLVFPVNTSWLYLYGNSQLSTSYLVLTRPHKYLF